MTFELGLAEEVALDWQSRSRPAPTAADQLPSGDGIALAVKARANSRSKSKIGEVFSVAFMYT